MGGDGVMPEGFTYSQWQWFMENSYEFMPDWYWNIEKRKAEYQKYKEES